MKMGEKLLELINLNNEMIQMNRNKIEKLVECIENQQEQIDLLTDLVFKKHIPEFKNGGKEITISKEDFLNLAADITVDHIHDSVNEEDMEFTAHIPVVASIIAAKLFDEKKKEEKK